MRIQELFQKKIDRDIQGVIIAGQGTETCMAQELDEYVVTQELQRHFRDFFTAYKKGIRGETPKMGVWISGFFGSGKSHFLKILSYLLKNERVGGRNAIDYFEQDKKIVDSSVLADMKLAASTPTDVVLFNIDAKSDSGGKHNKDAILNVFLRVFNEMQGFCGALPALADLEQRLSAEGRFDAYRARFQELHGSRWEDSRQDFDFIQDTVVKALSEIGFMSEVSARNWCEKALEPYKLSIEDFANRVKRYIDRKGGNHHVVFLVDEVGQYIGNDSKLMLNLQTVTEELGRACMGKAWIVVTSQQDIDAITEVKGNDFSKIQGRFETRLNLTSAHVDEVIKRRILAKTDTAAQTLRLLYEQQAINLGSVVQFTGEAEKKLYADGADFVNVYPFVGYQFNLLASVLTMVRTHSASGKHLSEGERSMLAMYKESAEKLKEQEVGVLAPFHMFYDAMAKFLDHSHSGVITRAYGIHAINPDGEEDVFAVNVLKVLFLIKYVKEIDANLENLTSLMVDSMTASRAALKDRVEESLKLLMRQMLVQKTGSTYVFLTNEEQEINREIERQQVDPSEVRSKTAELIFDSILPEKRYRYPLFNNRYSFSFNPWVDDFSYKNTRSYDIGLRILTPRYENATDDNSLRLRSGENNEAIVLLPEDLAFWDELRTHLKINKFLSGEAAARLTQYEEIKIAKQKEAGVRLENSRLYLIEAMKAADIYVNGDHLRTGTKDVTGRIREALERLVQTVYHKLPYIDTPMDEVSVRKLLKRPGAQVALSEEESTVNAHAVDDLRDYIALISRSHDKITLKAVKDRYTKAPYGFIDDDIHWLVACLFQRGELDFTVGGSPVTRQNTSEDKLADYITKKAFVEKLQMAEHVRIPDKEKKAVRTVLKELFHAGSVSDDEETLMQEFQRRSHSLLQDMNDYFREYQSCRYPGKKVIESGRKLLREVETLEIGAEFFSTVFRKENDFLDLAEDYEPVAAFFSGEQKEIFQRVCKLIDTYEDSKTYIVDEALEEIVDSIRAILRKEHPYNEIHKLPELAEKFTDAYMQILGDESIPVQEAIEEAQKRVMERLSGKPYEASKKDGYLAQFREFQKGVESCNNIATLRGFRDKAEALKLRLLNEMDKLDAELLRKLAPPAKQENGKPAVPPPPVRKSKNVSMKSIARTASWRLEKPEDIDRVLSDLRKALTEALANNDIVNVEF